MPARGQQQTAAARERASRTYYDKQVVLQDDARILRALGRATVFDYALASDVALPVARRRLMRLVAEGMAERHRPLGHGNAHVYGSVGDRDA